MCAYVTRPRFFTRNVGLHTFVATRRRIDTVVDTAFGDGCAMIVTSACDEASVVMSHVRVAANHWRSFASNSIRFVPKS